MFQPARLEYRMARALSFSAMNQDGEHAAHGLARTVGVYADAGEPGRLLVTIAAQRHVDLVVVGARSETGTVPAGPKSLGTA